MQDRIKIELRQKQLYLNNDLTMPVIVNWDAMTGLATYVPGVVPQPNFTDFTQYADGMEDFKLNWSASDATGDDNDTGNDLGSNYTKGLTGDITFSGAGFQFIFDWLMTNPGQVVNAVEVRLTDMACSKSFRTLEIKNDNVKYSPDDEPCIVNLPLRELDNVFHSFQKTPIEDDWQGWFNSQGTSTKDHPTFPMIVERKPKLYMAIYAAMIYIVGILSIGIVTTLAEGKRWIRRTLGFSYFCPSPLIRDYIKNICDKYGYTYDTIFDDLPGNPYRDACLFYPVSATYKNFDDFFSPSTKFIWDNRTVMPFTMFLNKLKLLFNAEWYVTPNSKLVFKHKSFFDTSVPIYDFTAPGSMKRFNFRYIFNGKKKAAYGEYYYSLDPQDTCGNEVKWRYDTIVDYDGPVNNPMLEGHVSKNFDFALTAFHNDGSSPDFLEEGVELGRLVAIGAIVLGLGNIFLAANPLTAAAVAIILAVGYAITNNYVNTFFNNPHLNGIVRASNSEINIPRILLWDRTSSLDEAKVVFVENPVSYHKYNTTDTTYYNAHPSQDDPAYFGTTVTKIYNYPLFIDELFKDNLFDRFHEYDSPLFNPEINQTWEMDLDLCCEWLDILGAWSDQYARIGAVIVLEKRGARFIKGRITGIDLDYKTGNIHLQGVVLK